MLDEAIDFESQRSVLMHYCAYPFKLFENFILKSKN